MLSIKNQSNYLARVFVLPELKPHPNADRLAICNFLGYSIITSKSAEVNTLYIYCPLESTLNKDFLKFTNSFSESSLNADTTKKAFFPSSARVRSASLRGMKSEGYIFPAIELEKWLKSIGIDYKFTPEDVNKDFDYIGNILFIEKYVNKQLLIDAVKASKREKVGRKARESKIIEGQYYLASDTDALKRNMDKISPDDDITISYKLHGANFSAGRVLCKKQLKWYEKVLKWVGVNVVDKEYQLLWASRRVIKNCFYSDKEQCHFYGEDVWGKVAETYKDSIVNGVTIHGEIVNQLPNGSWIQKNYDYGVPPTKTELFVYRIFYTNDQGKIFEFNTDQIIEYCAKYGLKTVPIFYQGKAKDLFPELSATDHWRENFLEKLKKKYTEKKCYICKNDVWEEGVVLVKNTKNKFEAFKLKSLNFLDQETAELDSGVVNIEDTN